MQRLWFSTGVAALVLAVATAAAAKPCWERVMDDWTDNSSVDGAYSIACLQAAFRHAPQDIRVYSNFEEELGRARQTAARHLQSQPRGPERPSPRGLFDAALNVGASDSGSPPRPLIVLVCAALLLAVAGAAGHVARRLRARKRRA